jgi:tetratricopeptide (TPR) repeat protein
MKKPPELTRRERDVLVVLCRPFARGAVFTEPASIREVAETLGVSEAAVKQHLTNLYDKFGIFEGTERRRVRLANIALSEGIVTRDKSDAVTRQPETDPLAEGRSAVALRSWGRAYEYLARANAAGADLSADDLESLGDAAIWVGRHDESIAARQRAHAIHVRDGHNSRAAAVEIALGFNHLVRRNMTQASGWWAKAKRRLQTEPPGAVHGYLAAMESLLMFADGDLAGSLEHAQRAFAAGEEFGDVDLYALGLVLQGYALANLGRMAEATPLLDEAMASATSGELGPLATGFVYCRTICACLDALDYRRAQEWTDAIDHVAGDECTAGFPGDCRAHRAALLAVHGEWAKAESEARTACNEAERLDLRHTGLASYEIGQVRLRSGDLEVAAAAFQRSHELGVNPQPGLALLHLERGENDAAAASIRSAVEETAPGSLRRARLLQAQAEIAHALSDTQTARAAADELARIAEMHGTTALKAAAESAVGVASLAEGKHSTALGALRNACRLWLEADAPYEAARARMYVASALRARDDKGSAMLELETARAALERLGGRPEADRAAHALAELRGQAGS